MINSLGKTPTILMVDDHEENLKVVAGILLPEKYDLVPAMSGQQALDRVKAKAPDLILLDIMLPDISGVEVCKQLHNDPRWRDIPVVFLSAADDSETIVTALESGGVDYISKPFNQAELLTRVRTHLALKIARDELKSLAADKDQLLRVMAHDFKNQISGVLMSAKLILEREESGTLSERSLKLIRNIHDSSDRMMGFLKGFLANQESQKKRVKVRKINIEDTIRSAIQEIEPAALLKDSTINFEPSIEGWVALGDENACRQIFENLIGNAVKFCPRGATIEIKSKVEEGRRVEICVCDDGPGFTPEDRDKIFKRYSKLSARPSGGEPSTGLGLYITKGLIEDMGGTIQMCDDDRGACFILSFRARPLAETEICDTQ